MLHTKKLIAIKINSLINLYIQTLAIFNSDIEKVQSIIRLINLCTVIAK